MIQADRKCDACGRTETIDVSGAGAWGREPPDYEWTGKGWHRIARTKCWLCPPCTQCVVGHEVARANELRRQAEAKADQFRRRAHAAEAKLEDQ